MKLETVKAEHEIPLEKVVKVNLTIVNNATKSLDLTFESGKVLHCSQESYSSFVCAVTAPVKLVEVERIRGTVLGKTSIRLFKDKSAANEYEKELGSISSTAIVREIVKVPEDTANCIQDSDEVPF